MAVEKKTRHQRIYRFQRKLMAGVAAFILLTTGGGLAWNLFQNDAVSAETTTAQARADFWQIIAGEETPSEYSSATRLATDLRDATPQEIADFRVEPTDYPGVADKLGFNPFDNSGLSCTSCGPLSATTKSALEQIQNGQVSQLVGQELSSVEEANTFSAGTLIAWSTLVYVGGSIASVMMAVRRDSRRNGYAANTVDWRLLGSSDDTYKSKSRRLGLPYFIVVVPIKKWRGKDYEAALRKTFIFEDERELTELQNAVRELPEGQEREALQQVLYGLRDGIDEQVEAFQSPEIPFEPAAAQEVRNAITQRVEELQERVTLRRQAALDLQGSYPMNPTINKLHA